MATLQVQQRVTERYAESPSGPSIALLTPYSGGNFGDAAIQDSMILNLRARMPNARFLGITLNCQNFVKQHGAAAFPMLASLLEQHRDFPRSAEDPRSKPDSRMATGSRHFTGYSRDLLRRVPGARRTVRAIGSMRTVLRRELTHWVEGYRTLRSQDALFLSGGGQLDEEYGGPWRLPYAYFKWTLLAQLARVPCAMVSVGTGKIESIGSRLFVSAALRMCCYRSFRETRSKTAVARFFGGTANDAVIPDLAFSLPEAALPAPSMEIRTKAGKRPVVALSPIAYAKPINWPTADRALYERYVEQMAQIVSRLSEQGYFIVVVCSSMGDDESVVPDIVSRLDPHLSGHIESAMYLPWAKTWRELVAVLQQADYLVASRLHGIILSFVSQTPAVAISFDPKVDWVMQDLDQSEYLLSIRTFTAADVLTALGRLRSGREGAVRQLKSFRQNALSGSGSAEQYDYIAQLALTHHLSHA